MWIDNKICYEVYKEIPTCLYNFTWIFCRRFIFDSQKRLMVATGCTGGLVDIGGWKDRKVDLTPFDFKLWKQGFGLKHFR